MAIPVSVIIAVYNGERFIKSAIESVLSQTFQDFELIIVDDGSTDTTPQILNQFSDSKKITILRNPINKERSYSRNLAISHAHGKYIAILDSDDVCLPERLEKQVRYLEENTDIDVIGGQIKLIDDENKELELKYSNPITHKEIAWANLFYTPIIHSTAMIKTINLRKVIGYDLHWPPCEDADLWIRLLKSGAKFANIPDILTRYRTNERQKERSIKGLAISKEIRRLFLGELLCRDLKIDEYNLLFLCQKKNSRIVLSAEELISSSNLLLSAFNAFQNRNYFATDDLDIIHEDIINRLGKLMSHSGNYQKKLLLPFLMKLSTQDWIRLYWQSKKRFFGYFINP